MKRRIWSALLVLTMVLTMLPVTAWAVEPEAVPVQETVYIPDAEDLLDNDELFAAYFEKLMYAGLDQESIPFRVPAGNKLTGTARTVYDSLKSKIEEVADGTETSTVFTIELTVDNLTQDVLNAAVAEVKPAVQCLLVDCPETLYWYDKTSGYSANGSGSGKTITLTITFSVAQAYRGTTANMVNPDKITAAKSAIANAKNVVDANAGKSTYEKLVAYKQYICDNVTYNTSAAEDKTTPYGDPWQLIYVFDEDTSTNVVCEGYAKAFQYLCDLTADLGADCYTVSGEMGGGTGAGGHMWNIVRIGGNSYLVDVTNCDGNSIGAPDKLFLVGGGAGTARGGYTYKFDELNQITYKYYDGTKENTTNQFEVWEEEILTLAAQNYDPDAQPEHTHVWSKEWSSDETSHWHNCTVSDCPFTENSQKDGYGTHNWVLEETTDTARNYKCGTCGKTKQEAVTPHEHTWSTTWSHDDTYHWLTCSGCTEIKDKAAHNWQLSGSTETAVTYTCTCGATLTHKLKTEWTHDETGHWHDCADHSTCNVTSTKADHVWGEGKVTKEPTCTEAGVRTYTCVCGETKTESIAATGHTPSGILNYNDESHWDVCTDCGAILNKTFHTKTDRVTQNPTCTEKGSKTTTCSGCGWSVTADIEALGHQWSTQWSKDETNHWHVCTREGCNATSTAIAHTWNEGVETTKPTYGAPGVKTFTCTACGATKTETLAQLEHSYSADWSKDNDYHWHACLDEGFENLTKDKDLHNWDGGVETKPATADEDGLKTYTCTVCGQTKTEVIGATGHNYSETWSHDPTEHWKACEDAGCTAVTAKATHTWSITVDRAATHAADGEQTLTCTVCGYSKTEVIPKHAVSPLWSVDAENHWHACTDTSCTVKDSEGPHTMGSWSVTTPATFDAAGVETRTCTVCNRAETRSIPQLTHTYSTTWSKDSENHWHACTDAGYTELFQDKAAHTFVNGVCSVCGYDQTAPVEEYTITFDANGGTLSSASLTMTTGADGRLASLPGATRSGYTFLGWFTQASGGTQVTTSYVFTANTTVYAHWSQNSGGSSGGGSSNGGGSSSGGSSSVTVPVSGDRNSVKVSASVSGSTATVSKIDLDQLNTVAGSDVRTGMVEVDFSGLNRTINTVNLPTDAVKEIAKAANDRNNDAEGLTIKLSSGEASFDAAALDGIQQQASGSQLTLSIAKAGTASLNARQREVVGNSPVFDLTMKSGSKIITDFGGGYATISIPHTLAEGQDPSKVVVYYLDSNGNITPCETMYDVRSKSVIFTTSHFSKYVVSYEDTEADSWANPFRDVASNAYYLDAVRWALENNVTSGTSANTFSPDAVCTRAQMVMFLWRAAGSPAPQSIMNPFEDIQPGDYFYSAVLWAAEKGITSGTSATTFSPNSQVTRAQAVAILYQYAGAPAAAYTNRFADVFAEDYYAKAVSWAAENGVTSGTGATTFSPNAVCTRAQIVTFLYQTMK